MKPLEKMNNVEKGKFLADLLPEELPNITPFIEQEIQRFLKNEDHNKSIWKGTLITADFWYSLVRNVEKAIKQYGSRLHKNHRWFADQLFDGYNALFTINCLVEYASKVECNPKLRQGIHFLFSEAKIIQTTITMNNYG
ncbi:hypothetical protein J7E50_18250 [Pedobacter sp. ISL-68]|uniref:hypothetical protein n=1 Tax=unclassified Pedobacter TaxID=2628915 RepID=UPI001BEBDA7D|nr:MULTISPECIES: hypothetical protein [unclassified Pedobacter]MBT2559865.1 hypothetical protein [Pedobacter sp. ISL-64]MBT2592170.1 hypothetical protein [Pedobacter sp. ISL-68]